MDLYVRANPVNLLYTSFYAFFVLLILCCLCYIYTSKSGNRCSSDDKYALEASVAWSLLDHLLLFGGSKLPHAALGNQADTIIKSTCLAVLTGGTNTTTVTLTWALSLLLNNPESLKKAHEELDRVIGNERQVDESDMKNLVYLQAIIKETFRLYPAGTLLAPREFVEDCTLDESKSYSARCSHISSFIV